MSGGAARPAIGGIAAPHSKQNRCPGCLVSAPHAGQWSACGAPQWPQNFAPDGTSAEQLWHVELKPGSGPRSRRGRRGGRGSPRRLSQAVLRAHLAPVAPDTTRPCQSTWATPLRIVG